MFSSVRLLLTKKCKSGVQGVLKEVQRLLPGDQKAKAEAEAAIAAKEQRGLSSLLYSLLRKVDQLRGKRPQESLRAAGDLGPMKRISNSWCELYDMAAGRVSSIAKDLGMVKKT